MPAKRSTKVKVKPTNQRLLTAAHMEALTGSPVNWQSGHGSLRTEEDKIYCFINREGKLALKLPTERIELLLSSGEARFLTMGKRTMREWAVVDVPQSKKDLVLLREARTFVSSLPAAKKRKKS